MVVLGNCDADSNNNAASRATANILAPPISGASGKASDGNRTSSNLYGGTGSHVIDHRIPADKTREDVKVKDEEDK